MAETGMLLFDTAIGRCGVAWDGPRLTAVQLPERDDDATRRGQDGVSRSCDQWVVAQEKQHGGPTSGALDQANLQAIPRQQGGRRVVGREDDIDAKPQAIHPK